MTGFRLLTAVDTLDDRREVWHLLHRLPPRGRYRFLAWACTRVDSATSKGQCPTPRWLTMRPRVRRAEAGDEAEDRRLTTEVYLDLGCLAIQFGLDLGAVAPALEAVVRRGEWPAACARGPAPARTPGTAG